MEGDLSYEFQKSYGVKGPSTADEIRYFDKSEMSWDNYRASQPELKTWLDCASTLASSMKKVNENLEQKYDLKEFRGNKSKGYYWSLSNVVNDLHKFKKFQNKIYKISFDGKNVEKFGDFLIFTVSKLDIKNSQSPANQYIFGIFRAEEKYECLKEFVPKFDKQIDCLQKDGSFIFYLTCDFKCWRALSEAHRHCVFFSTQ